LGPGGRRPDREANRAFTEHAGRDAKVLSQLELSDGTALTSHPAFIKLMASVGEATPARGGSGGSAGSPEEEIARIQKEALAKGLIRRRSVGLHKELQSWYEKAYGTDELDTALNRGTKRRR
jgi:hypothetical protein